MSSIDVTKLIARKKFFVPVESSSLSELLLKQLDLGRIKWFASVQRPRSGTLKVDIVNEWAKMSIAD